MIARKKIKINQNKLFRITKLILGRISYHNLPIVYVEERKKKLLY